MPINPEFSIKDEKIEAEDRLAKEVLDMTRKPMEERITPEYREYVWQLLQDLQKDYLVEDVNAYEHGEYCVILKHKDTGEIKSYAFEAPLTVVLPALNRTDKDNAALRTAKLYNYLFEMTRKDDATAGKE
jgi:hypothetical protein